MTTWYLGPDDPLDHAPDIPILRTWPHTICGRRGPQNLRCDRPGGHTGRHLESLQDGAGDTEFRCAIGVWEAE